MATEPPKAASIPPPPGLTLGELAREIHGEVSVHGDAGVRLLGVHHDSRRVGPSDLFVVRKGETSDGARFLADAEARGAVAVCAVRGEIDPAATKLPILWVQDARIALAQAAAAVYGHPSFALDVVGVTGTNGKTTTTHLVRQAIDRLFGAPRCGVIGTVGHALGDEILEATHTTPEADELARLMVAMKKKGASHVAMEVSSIALSLARVEAVRFRVAAFTNLTQDHLDFHGSMEAYGAAKSRLFEELAPGHSVLNVGDPFGAAIAERLSKKRDYDLVTVSTDPAIAAAFRVIRADLGASGVRAAVATPVGEISLASRLVGAHNLENLLVVLAIGHALELDTRAFAECLAEATSAPGRLERCDGPDDDVAVLVDYAHTPDALERVLASLAGATKGRLFCVFGCGGDRDPTKRRPMGAIAARGADVAVVTNDNPRSEDPAHIAQSITVGLLDAGSPLAEWREIEAGAKGHHVELDRERAIDKVIRAAAPGDVVLLAGKGHEPYQIIGTHKRPFDDREVARAALAARRARNRG